MKIPILEPLERGAAPEDRQLRPGDDVVRHRRRRHVRVVQRPPELEAVDAEPDRDPVEHDRRDHLVGAGGRLQDPGDPRPRSAGGGCGDDREHDVKHRRHPGERRADPYADDPADGVLALAADVEHAGAERERDREADEDQRRGLDQRLLEVARRGRALGPGDPGEQPVEAGPVEDRLVGRERVVAGRQHDQPAGDERDYRRDDRHHDAAGTPPECGQRGWGPRGGAPALVGFGLEFLLEQAHGATSAVCAFPPVIAMPSSSSVASGGNSPTILPS